MSWGILQHFSTSKSSLTYMPAFAEVQQCHKIPGDVSECVFKEKKKKLMHKMLLFPHEILFLIFLYCFSISSLSLRKDFPKLYLQLCLLIFNTIPLNPSLWLPQISKLGFSTDTDQIMPLLVSMPKVLDLWFKQFHHSTPNYHSSFHCHYPTLPHLVTRAPLSCRNAICISLWHSLSVPIHSHILFYPRKAISS